MNGYEEIAIRARIAARLFGTTSAAVQIGRYEIGERIGAGGMGVVYSARDPELGRMVALKVLTPGGRDEPRHRRRLIGEARTLARLSHPNVVQIHEVGEHDGAIFLALELVDGETLAIWQRRPGRRWPEVLAAYLDAARGLAAAHEVGVVHSDVKPSNILVGADGRVRVADFGLAQATREDDTTALSGTARLTTQSASGPGGVAGTPAYMSPEQASGRSIDARSDLFSLCVALFEGLYGARPFAPDDLRGLFARGSIEVAALRGQLPRASRVPGWVLKILASGLQPDPQRRPPDMRTLIAAFERMPHRRQRQRLAAIGAVGLTLGAWGVSAVPASSPSCPSIIDTLAGAWDPAHKDNIHAQFVASRLPFAEAAWHQVERAVDSAVIAWSRELRASCVRTRVDHSQSDEQFDLAVECLAGHQQRIRDLITGLGEASPAVVTQAYVLVRELDDPSVCSNTDALRRGPALAISPTMRARVAELRRSLDEVRRLVITGSYARAVEQADALVAASAVHAPLHAEALYLRGLAAARRGDLNDADLRFAAALAEAEVVRDDRLAAVVAGEQTELAVQGYRNVARARIHANIYSAKLRRIAANDRARAEYFDRLGELELLDNDGVTALARHEEAAHLHTSDDLVGNARNLKGLANALAALGRHDESIERLQAARALFARNLGETHPATAIVDFDLAASLYELPERKPEDLAKALSLLRESLRIAEGHATADGLRAGRVRIVLALVLEASGEHTAALREAEQALEALRARLPSGHSDVETAQALLVNLYIDRRAWGPAATACAALISIYTERGQPIPIDLLINAGEFTLRLGHAPAATPYFDQALVLASNAKPPVPALLAHALNGRAKVYLARGEAGMARTLFEQAWRLLPQIDPPVSGLAAEVHWGIARAMTATGRTRTEARHMAFEALALFRQSAPDDPELPAIERFLGYPGRG